MSKLSKFISCSWSYGLCLTPYPAAVLGLQISRWPEQWAPLSCYLLLCPRLDALTSDPRSPMFWLCVVTLLGSINVGMFLERLEKGMAAHFSTLPWRIPWTEKPGGLQFMGLQRIRHDWVTYTHRHEHLGRYPDKMVFLVYLKVTNILPLEIHCFSPRYRAWDGNKRRERVLWWNHFRNTGLTWLDRFPSPQIFPELLRCWC